MAKLKRFNGSSWEDVAVDADTADKAAKDGNGKDINGTYLKKEAYGGYCDVSKDDIIATSPYVSTKFLVKMATIVIKSNYINCPIAFETVGRGQARSIIEIWFNSSDNVDPSLKSFTSTGYTSFYIMKSTASTWDVYCKFPETYANVSIVRMVTDLNAKQVTITYPMDISSDTLPDGAIQASKLYVNEGDTRLSDARKNPNAITFKDINGSAQSYDGSSKLDLTGGLLKSFNAESIIPAGNGILNTDCAGSTYYSYLISKSRDYTGSFITACFATGSGNLPTSTSAYSILHFGYSQKGNNGVEMAISHDDSPKRCYIRWMTQPTIWYPMANLSDIPTTTGKITSVVDTSHPNNEEYVVTKSFISYWNGAYDGSGNSNLKFCSTGYIIGSGAINNYVKDAKLTIQANGTAKGTFTANASSDVTINISASDLGLSGAMKFIGTTTTGISEGSTTQSILIGATTVTAEAGNVVLKGDKELIWTGSKWEELGDEQSHALKSITVKGSGILSGGGSLEANREITHNQVARTNSSTMSAAPGFGQSFTAIGGVGSDSYGHVNAVDTKTITIPNTTASQSAAGLMSASDKTKLDGIAEGANSITYELSATDATDSGDAAITLTPSSGDAQTVEINTVYNAKSANKATHDSDGNIIASTYVKNTSDSVLSGWAKTFSIYLNKEAYPNGIPWLSSSKSTIQSQLTGEYATISALDYLSLYDYSKKSVTPNSITTTSNRTYAVMRNEDSQLVVNVPWTDTVYSLPAATASTLGGIKTTFGTNSEYGLTFTNGNYGISLKGYSGGIQFAASNYRITDIETGTISLASQAFTAGTSIAKSVTFHNTSYVNSSGTTTSGAKQGDIRVFLQFVGYNGEYMTCGLISLSNTGFTAYVRSTDTLSASSTRYIHWIKVREY